MLQASLPAQCHRFIPSNTFRCLTGCNSLSLCVPPSSYGGPGSMGQQGPGRAMRHAAHTAALRVVALPGCRRQGQALPVGGREPQGTRGHWLSPAVRDRNKPLALPHAVRVCSCATSLRGLSLVPLPCCWGGCCQVWGARNGTPGREHQHCPGVCSMDQP